MGRRVKSYNRLAGPTTFVLAPFYLGVFNFAVMMIFIFIAIFTGGNPVFRFFEGVAVHLLMVLAITTEPFIFRILETFLENTVLAIKQGTRNIRYVRE